MGHLNIVGMMRMLRRAAARKEVIEACKHFKCQACGDAQHQKHPAPTRYVADYVFGAKLAVDTFTVHDVVGDAFHFMNILCLGSAFQVCAFLGHARGIPSADACLSAFTRCWASWAGMPTALICDRGKENQGSFARALQQHGVEIDQAALESPWQMGKCERHGAIWKDIFAKVCHDTQIQGNRDVETVSVIINQTKNDLYRQAGYSPSQWVFGCHGV